MLLPSRSWCRQILCSVVAAAAVAALCTRLHFPTHLPLKCPIIVVIIMHEDIGRAYMLCVAVPMHASIFQVFGCGWWPGLFEWIGCALHFCSFRMPNANTTHLSISGNCIRLQYITNLYKCILQAILTSTRIFPLCRPQLRLSGFGLRSWRPDECRIARETDAHLVQAPSVAHDEIVLFDQSQSGRQRSETTVAEDRTAEAGITGKYILQ